MYKVLIAEDERPIARNIAKNIKSINPAFTVKSIAYNGEQALDYLKSTSYDVAFLDINMPIINGLDVLQYVSTNNLPTICIMLSGYQDFTYAQTALQSNALDYLTKPLDILKLRETLSKVEILINRNKRTKALSLNTQIPHELFENASTSPNECYLGCLLFSTLIGKLYSPETIENFNQQLNSIKPIFDIYLGHNNYWITSGHEAVEFLILVSGTITNLKPKINSITTESKRLGYTFGASFTQHTVSMTDINPLYKSLRNSLESVITYDHSIALFYNPDAITQAHSDLNKKVFHQIESYIMQITPTTSFVQMKSILNECLNLCHSKRKLIVLACQYLFTYLCSNMPSNIHYFDIESDILELLENALSEKEVNEKLCSLISDNFYFLVSNSENKKQLALQIQDYLVNNYQYPFSNQILADRFGFVPYYLRRIFKEVYKQSPTEYIMTLRIEKSKELLSQKMLAKDVALLTGFKDPLYFSKVFKKTVGKTPTEFVKTHLS